MTLYECEILRSNQIENRILVRDLTGFYMKITFAQNCNIFYAFILSYLPLCFSNYCRIAIFVTYSWKH